MIDDDPALPAVYADSMLVTKRPAWVFGADESTKQCQKHFDVKALDGFGFESHEGDAIRAAGAILEYLNETQKASLSHIDRLVPYRAGTALEIDHATRRSLELTRTLRDGQRNGALLGVLDRTTTAMGSRLLGDWLSAPLTDIAAIEYLSLIHI